MCTSAFDDYVDDQYRDLVYHNLNLHYTYANDPPQQFYQILNEHKSLMKLIGKTYQKWNKFDILNTHLGFYRFQVNGFDFNSLYEESKLWEQRYRLFLYSPLALKAALSSGDITKQNENVSIQLASFDEKRTRLENNQNFMNQYRQYSRNMNEEDKEIFLCELVGHCDQPEDIQEHLQVKNDWIRNGNDWFDWNQRIQFEQTMNQTYGLDNRARRIRTVFNQVTPEVNRKIDDLKTILLTNYSDKFTPVDLTQIETIDFKDDGNGLLSYLEGEKIYQEFLTLMPPNKFPPTFKQYIGNQDVHTALTNMRNLFNQKNGFAKTIIGDTELKRAIEEYNEVVDINDRYSIEKILYLEKPTTSIELTQKFRRMLQERVNGIDRDDLLEKTLNEIWRPLFPQDMSVASTWRTEWEGNFNAITAIRKLARYYKFYYQVQPWLEFNLKKFVQANNNSIDQAYNVLSSFYNTFISTYNQWQNSTALKGYLNEYKNEFGGTIELAGNYFFGKLKADFNHALEFFKAY
ncbi:hypothetical protein M9Y10_014095 [Tritrichomonas musculus]|uniref:Uncharacterized protein n=1 Tax=Tritrichomonas musculus TaxID=1915356 RepID=A0ABR2KYK2_9EUKA